MSVPGPGGGGHGAHGVHAGLGAVRVRVPVGHGARVRSARMVALLSRYGPAADGALTATHIAIARGVTKCDCDDDDAPPNGAYGGATFSVRADAQATHADALAYLSLLHI